jgi:hypothetical protein
MKYLAYLAFFVLAMMMYSKLTTINHKLNNIQADIREMKEVQNEN